MDLKIRHDHGPAPGAVLARGFFDRPATEVAPDLLGCVLTHDSPDGLVVAVIVETEAYDGGADPASHAYRGRTRRNAVMFGPPGHAYVYVSYGVHCCVNLVCRPPGQASAVLLRAARVVAGAALAAARRGTNGRSPGRRSPGRPQPAQAGQPGVAGRELARGPGRLCAALGIDCGHDGVDVCSATSVLRVGPGPGPGPGPVSASGGGPPGNPMISRGPRVGVSRAADVPWRFWLAGDPCVSPYRPYYSRRGPAAGRASGTMPR